MAEQPAVNRQVLGSNPSQGALIELSANATLLFSPLDIGCFTWHIAQ